MKTADISRRAAAVVVIALLAACGGGGGGSDDSGGGNGGGGGGGGGGGSNPGTPTAVTGQYRLQPAATDFTGALAAMNAQGAQGYAYVSALGASGAPGVFGDFYVSDTAHAASRLEYVTEPALTSADAALAQMNARGAQGYAYKAGAAYGTTLPIEQRSIYVKDTSRSTTYTYERRASTSATTRAAYEAQLNEQGARGYRLVGPMFVSGDQFTLYVKDNSGTTYSYSLRDWVGSMGAADGAALQTQLTEMGAQGYMYQGGMGLQGQTVVQFEKSSAQNGAVEYVVEESKLTSLEQMLARMNERAAQGFFLFSDVVANDGKTYTISVKNAPALRHPLAGISFP